MDQIFHNASPHDRQCIFEHEFSAHSAKQKPRAEIITPTNTATARSSITVITETMMITDTSSFGTLFQTRKLAHSKVAIATINITPTNTAIGTTAMISPSTSIKDKRKIAAKKEDSRALAPELILIIV